MSKVSFEEFAKALVALEKALAEAESDIARDATIQRFEFCVDLAWKTSKKWMGTLSTAPRAVIREMAQQGLISNPQDWLDFLEARNLSSHTYKEELAQKVYKVAEVFLKHGQALLEKLKNS